MTVFVEPKKCPRCWKPLTPIRRDVVVDSPIVTADGTPFKTKEDFPADCCRCEPLDTPMPLNWKRPE